MNRNLVYLALMTTLLLTIWSWSSAGQHSASKGVFLQEILGKLSHTTLATHDSEPEPALVASARQQIGVTVRYDPAYSKLSFPNGDVPIDRGVCTDVVVRAYRSLGLDLQALVNADMKKAWDEYPKIWDLSQPDSNIDHRRVPNLQTFFARHDAKLPISDKGSDYLAGDLVTWKVLGRPHIGIVSNRRLANDTPLIIHNIGRGTEESDILFEYPISGHYRYHPNGK
ncbi:MAG: DUF1287 domain-containing protein [Psychrobacter sp.]|nr:DUF1287 domain-containing protein [Psychrobacter sp.]